MFDRAMVPSEYRKLARLCGMARDASKIDTTATVLAVLKMAVRLVEGLPEVPPAPRKAPAHLTGNAQPAAPAVPAPKPAARK